MYGVACGRCNGIFGDFGSMQGHFVSKQHYTLGAGIFIPARPRARLREKKGCTGRPWKRRGPTNEIDNRNEPDASCQLRFPRNNTLFPSYLRIITLHIGKNNANFFLFFIQEGVFFFFFFLNLAKVKRAYNKYPTIKLQHKWAEKSPVCKEEKISCMQKRSWKMSIYWTG